MSKASLARKAHMCVIFRCVDMVFVNLSKLSFLIVQSFVVVLSDSYYQMEYSGYLFTTSSRLDTEWRYQDEAKGWCSRNGSKLLAITNSSIQNAVVAFVNDAIKQTKQGQLSYNKIITDGQRTYDNWKWINGTFTHPIDVTVQDNGGYALSYGYLNTRLSGFSLWAAKPTDSNYYICEYSNQTSCVNGYQRGSQCFQSFSNETLSWFEARNRCVQSGGDLATFEFISSNSGLNILNGSWINPSTNYWIGVRRLLWTWQSMSSDVTYSQWSAGHPVFYDYQYCICLLPSEWKWVECSCGQRYQFVCIKAVDFTTTALKTTATSVIPSSQSPSTLNNSIPQSSPSTIAIQNETNALSSTADKGSNRSLAIGVGVGVGGGVLLIILIIVLILLSRKGYISFSRKSKDTSSSSPPPPDVIGTQPPNAIYAPICQSNEGFQDDIDSNQATAEYAPLQIVDTISYSKHHTLSPPAMSGGPTNTEL